MQTRRHTLSTSLRHVPEIRNVAFVPLAGR